MDDSLEQSPEQLEKNLSEYKEQLKEVEQLLLDDPDNSEYKEIYSGLQEVIQLTQELRQASVHVEDKAGPGQLQKVPVAAITEAPEVKVPSVLPPQIKDQIRIAQQRAALAGQAPAEWAIGAQVQARYGGDGLWYDSEVIAISTSGKFIVKYTNHDTQDEVDVEDLRTFDQQHGQDQEYKGVAAPKRNSVKDTHMSLDEPPAWMKIKPSDDEKTKQKKKKLLKSFKSKQRFQKMDMEQKKKADNWKNFLAGKVSKKKKTGIHKGSMFRPKDKTMPHT
ncbi:hypothetical protein M9434_004476 [Picochlorum sp. BPE23]|nr:hypothetical protein M9434_004476 [Picochlorum sp. BPE23]